MPFTDSAVAIVVLAAAAGFATGFFRPASYAGLPNLVSAADLPTPTRCSAPGEYLSWTIGTALGGVIVAVSSPDVAYWINAATFLVSAAFILRIAPSLLQTTGASRVATGAMWATGSRWSSARASCSRSSARGTS